MKQKPIEADIKQERTFGMGEIGAREVEVAERTANVNSEAFANEILTIRVATSALDPCPVHTSVNGVNQYIVRGKPQKVKRKYVEALARARTYTYDQEQGDVRDPSNIRMVERMVLSYPFEVLNDPNPKGRQWIEGILAS